MGKSKIKSRYKNPKVALSMQEVDSVANICGATALDTRHSVIRTENRSRRKNCSKKMLTIANCAKIRKGIR